MPWLRSVDGGVVITVHAQPGAKRTQVVGVHGEALKIRLAAPPLDGKANAALISFVAAQVGARSTAVTLLSGEASRAKRLHISGVAPGIVRKALLPA